MANMAALRFKRTVCSRDKQAEDQCGHRANQAGTQPDNIFRIISEMMLRQCFTKIDASEGTTKNYGKCNHREAEQVQHAHVIQKRNVAEMIGPFMFMLMFARCAPYLKFKLRKPTCRSSPGLIA